MDGEINDFVKILVLAITSICYCYYVAARFRLGITRLITLLPIFYLFVTLPLNLSSVHLRAGTALFLVWLANFKLFLFAFDNGPLISDPPLPLYHFINFALLPITPAPKNVKINVSGPTFLAFRLIFLAIIIHLYDYRPYLHPNIISALYCCHLFLSIELAFALSGIYAHAVIGLEIEPQFKKPYLATSPQDFWGRRWNLHVSHILRLTVYNPALKVGTRILGRKWGRPLAIFITFLVSGLMHEVCFFYVARVAPTWEVTCFMALHGLCTAAEVAAKTAVGGRFRLHRMVSTPLTIGFVAGTTAWLFLPQMIKHSVDLKLVNEYSIFSSFMRHKIISLCTFFLIIIEKKA